MYGRLGEMDSLAKGLGESRAPEVGAALDRLNRELSEIDENLSNLQVRLSCVTRPSDACQAAEPEPAYATSLAAGIGELATRAHYLRNRLRYQLDALELP